MTQPQVSATQADRGWFGHPRGLSTLFFTEMWERFSFYGLRALLILYMTAAAANGGLGFSTEHAASIYGWYTFGVYAAAIPGGILADRWLGQYRSVLVGGIIIALGHFSLAYPSLPTFYLGLMLIVIGTGLLKPNISTMVGSLYDSADVRRDAGFVQAARLSGNGEYRILLVHILPNIMPIMIVQMSLTMGYAILNAAGLSFIGLGVRPPTAEWGIMVAEGAGFMVSGEWWIALFPGLALMIAVFCFNLLGDGLRDIVDPQRRT